MKGRIVGGRFRPPAGLGLIESQAWLPWKHTTHSTSDNGQISERQKQYGRLLNIARFVPRKKAYYERPVLGNRALEWTIQFEIISNFTSVKRGWKEHDF